MLQQGGKSFAAVASWFKEEKVKCDTGLHDQVNKGEGAPEKKVGVL